MHPEFPNWMKEELTRRQFCKLSVFKGPFFLRGRGNSGKTPEEERESEVAEMARLMPGEKLQQLDEFVSSQLSGAPDQSPKAYIYNHHEGETYTVSLPMVLLYHHGLLKQLEEKSLESPLRLAITGITESNSSGQFYIYTDTEIPQFLPVKTGFEIIQDQYIEVVPTQEDSLLSFIDSFDKKTVVVGGKVFENGQPSGNGIFLGIDVVYENGEWIFNQAAIVNPDSLFAWNSHVNAQEGTKYLEIVYFTTPLGEEESSTQVWLNFLEVGENNYHRLALAEVIDLNEMKPNYNSLKPGSTKNGDEIIAFLFKDLQKGGYGVRINRFGPPFSYEGMQPVGRETINLADFVPEDFVPVVLSLTPNLRQNSVILTVGSSDGRIIEFEQDENALFIPREEGQVLGGAFPNGSPIKEMIAIPTLFQPKTIAVTEVQTGDQIGPWVFQEGFSVKKIFLPLVKKARRIFGFSPWPAQVAAEDASRQFKLVEETEEGVRTQRLKHLRWKKLPEDKRLRILTLIEKQENSTLGGDLALTL